MNLVKTGVLADTAAFPVAIGDLNCPITLTLTSAAGGRLIEVSSNGGLNYYSPTVTNTVAGMINIAITTPITHARFTGAAADVWRVQ